MFQLKISTDNAAFVDNGAAAEVASILRAIAKRVERGDATGLFQTIFDSNGNEVGRFKLNDE